MSHRSTLRTAVLTAVAAAAVLVPSTGAFATDDTPTPVPSTAQPTPAEKGPPPAPTASEPPVAEPSAVPRGGVAAGERPAGNGGDTAALYGAAIGTVLLAGAGTLMLHRRTAAHRNS